jgi:predicted  nucleic acid-binding Zn-ribbon protein
MQAEDKESKGKPSCPVNQSVIIKNQQLKEIERLREQNRSLRITAKQVLDDLDSCLIAQTAVEPEKAALEFELRETQYQKGDTEADLDITKAQLKATRRELKEVCSQARYEEGRHLAYKIELKTKEAQLKEADSERFKARREMKNAESRCAELEEQLKEGEKQTSQKLYGKTDKAILALGAYKL